MASINFVDLDTIIPAAWLNEADALVHDVFAAAQTKEAARAAISAAPAFRGALVFSDANQTIAINVLTAVQFPQESYDTDGIHDNAVNNTRLTVPAGVTKVRLIGNIHWADDVTDTDAFRTLIVGKNGQGNVSTIGCATERWGPGGQNGGGNFWTASFSGAVINVIAGDFFEMLAFQTGVAAGLAVSGTDNSTWFAMEIIE